MAVLTNPIIQASGGGGGLSRWAVLSFQNVTTGDTFDCASLTQIPPFVTVTAALGVAASNRAATVTLGTIATNTNVTILGASMARDSVVLFVLGE